MAWDNRPSEGKSVSFYIALFLGLLLLVSVALNAVLLLVNLVGSAADGITSVADDRFQVVRVEGDASAEDRVLLITLQGAIAEAGSPFLGATGGSVSQVKRGLDLAARDASVRGVLLEIDSPGGGVTDSDEIYHDVMKFRAETSKPVVALFGDLAASGGYYVAAACDHIVSRPTTLTGSIGVILSSYNVAEAAENWGIKEIVIKSDNTPYKDILSATREMVPAEREILDGIVEQLYQKFVDIVHEGRKHHPKLVRREAVVALANGSIYTGWQALDNGLVDSLGYREDALQQLKTTLGTDKLQLIEYRRRPGLRELLVGASTSVKPPESVWERLLGQLSAPRLLYFWPGAR